MTSALRDILARFGIEARSIREVRTGRVNRHWRVIAEDGRAYALRQYASPPYLPPLRSPASIAFEHEALRYAAGKGWPVAVPLSALDGGTLVDHVGGQYALFPWRHGRPSDSRSMSHFRLKGRLLARLHLDMATFGAGEQRIGFGRMWELDQYPGATLSLNEALRRFGQTHHDDAAVIRAQRYRSLRELSRLGYGELPAQFGHFDFHRDNLLFQQGELTALLDFDSAHLDARVADIATSIALDCIEPPAYNTIDVEAAQAFVGGYAASFALNEQEASLIVPLVRSWIIAAAAGRLVQWLAAPDPRVVLKVQRTTRYRIPGFEQRRDAMEEAVRRAANVETSA